MDDRMRRDNNGNVSNNQFSQGKNISADVDIDSNGVNTANTQQQKPKKFEVHIPESNDLYTQIPKQPVRPPQKRPAPSGASARRPASRASAAANGKTASNKAKASNRTKNKKVAAASKEKTKKEKKKNSNFGYTFVKGFLITCVCVIFVSTVAAVLSNIAMSFINDILVIDKKNKNYSVTVEIPEGSTYDDIFEILESKGLISQPFLTDFFCRFRDYDAETYTDEDGNIVTENVEYAPGVYYIDADSGIETILNSMLVYNNVNKDTVTLTFPEGWTIAEIFEKLEKYRVCDADKLYANLDAVSSQFDFISSISDTEGRYLKAEGYLFPDTYDFFIDENASSVLKKLFSNFEAKWLPEYDEQLKKLAMTKDQIITLASIIQAEAKDGSQMADISSVLHNRLKDPATYPNLQMNSTMDYITSLKSYNVFTDVYYNMYLSSYNTYDINGLPPGAICNPGITAIEAALYPSDTDYYFFCHDDNGAVYYASTATEHQQNVESVVYGTANGDTQ
ncbi:MAG: endolytic transglycosylase MltG [Acutalibacteraceae bacterium]